MTLKIAGRSIASWGALKDMKELYAHLMDPVASPLQKEETRKEKNHFDINKEQGLLMFKGDGKAESSKTKNCGRFTSHAQCEGPQWP